MPTPGTSAWKWPARERNPSERRWRAGDHGGTQDCLRDLLGDPCLLPDPRAFTAIIGRCDLNSKTGRNISGSLSGAAFFPSKETANDRPTSQRTGRPVHRPLYPAVPGAFRQGAGVPGITAGITPPLFLGRDTGRPGIPVPVPAHCRDFYPAKTVTRKGRYFFLNPVHAPGPLRYNSKHLSAIPS